MLRKLLQRLLTAISRETHSHRRSGENDLNKERSQCKVIRIYPQEKKHSATIIRIC